MGSDNFSVRALHALSLLVLTIASAITLLSLLSPLSAHALDVPRLEGHVNDYAGMISPQARAELDNELRDFERTDSTQIVILTVPSLEGDTIEDFGIKAAEAWKIGHKGKDNGVIFIVAKQDRKTRIEVGRGLEGKLTDLMAGRIVNLVVSPRFKRGDFDGGFISGVSSLIDATRGEFKSDGDNRPQRPEHSSRLITLLIFGGIILLVLGSISRILGGVAGAAGLPALALLAGLSPGLGLLIVLAIAGFGAGLLLPLLFSSAGHSGGGGFWPGGGFFGSGGGAGGGGFGGGGFSGGGGDFGGGGASGGW
ncbi:MAG: TPM domain-containing protein [Thermodesulfovibrionales bacterium]